MKYNKKDINVMIGSNIQKARERAGLTQANLSEQINIGTKSLSAIERGVTGTSLVKLKQICDVLSIPVDSVLQRPISIDNEKEIEISQIVEKLRRLSPEEFDIVKNVLGNVFRAFRIRE